MRFLSLHWNAHDAPTEQIQRARQRIAQRLSPSTATFNSSGLSVYYWVAPSDRQVVHPLERWGIVLGTVFRRTAASTDRVAALQDFSDAEADRIAADAGRSLTSDYWGSYVAVLGSHTGSGSRVLRAPLGAIKCFHVQSGDLHFFFSDLEAFAQLSLVKLEINWSVVSAQAACADYLGPQTALRNLSAIETGECAEPVGSTLKRSFYWNPCDIAKSQSLETFELASAALRTTTQMCVGSWSTHYGHIVHHVSGGIDSSISAACARKVLRRASMPCVNYFSPDVNGDERRFARDVAGHNDLELLEQEREKNVDLEIFGACRRTAWPALDFSGYAQYRKEIELAKARGANAIFVGELGDNLFDHGVGLEAAADYVWRRGVRPGLIAVAMDAALRRNLSVWHVLRRAIRDGLKPSAARWNSLDLIERELDLRISDLTLVRTEVLQSVRQPSNHIVHPWLRSSDGMPPGKFMLIYGLYSWATYEPPFATLNDIDLVAPLASQPVAETCLCTPTYFCIRGGVDRAVARHAFAEELPRSVLLRATKGTPEMWSRDVIRRNQEFLRAFLMDGVLVREGILDRDRVEAAFSNEIHTSRVFIADVFVQLYIEAWVRRWHAGAVSLAA